MKEKYFKINEKKNLRLQLILVFFSCFLGYAQQGNPCNTAFNVTVGSCNTFGTNGSNSNYWTSPATYGCFGSNRDDSWASFQDHPVLLLPDKLSWC